MNKFLVFALFSVLVGCSSPEPESDPEQKEPEKVEQVQAVDDAKRDEIIEYLTSDAEPTIKDAIFKQDNHLGVAVVDDDSNRDGFADYLCTVLKDDYSLTGVRVTVYDIMQLVNDNKWVELGKSNCE